METRNNLSDSLSNVQRQFDLLTKRYGSAKPPRDQAYVFNMSIKALVNAIGECKDEKQIEKINSFLTSITMQLGYGEIDRYNKLTPYAVAAGVVGWAVGSYTEPSGLSDSQSYLYKRNSAIVGAGVGIAFGRFFSRSSAEISEGYHYYRDIMHEVESAIQNRHPRPGLDMKK